MHLDDYEKAAFVTELGVFVAVVMMFGLKTAPATFQRTIMEIFGDFIPRLCKSFSTTSPCMECEENIWAVYGYV